MNIIKYTGKHYFKRKFFGGFDIYVEVIYTYNDLMGEESPQFSMFVKADEQDLSNFQLVIK